MFDKMINEGMKESKERWENIETLLTQLKESDSPDLNQDLVTLVSMLIEQIRPAYSPESLEQSMGDFMKMFTGGNTDDK